MALKKLFEVEGQAYIQDANGQIDAGRQKLSFTGYCKIIGISADKAKGTIRIKCSDGNYTFIKQYEVPLSVSDDAPNFIRQAYLYLKTLPEWADAIDC